MNVSELVTLLKGCPENAEVVLQMTEAQACDGYSAIDHIRPVHLELRKETWGSHFQEAAENSPVGVVISACYNI